MRKFEFDDLIKEEANLIYQENLTIRLVAKEVGRSKSSVFLDVTKRLEKMDITLYNSVREILQEHKQIRHIHGGQEIKEKYERIRNNIV